VLRRPIETTRLTGQVPYHYSACPVELARITGNLGTGRSFELARSLAMVATF